MMKQETGQNKMNRYLLVAVLMGLLIHGTAMFFTLEKTYDALIHLFFADHYAEHWFESWNPKWYTGFSLMGYPPLVHQVIAILSGIGGLKFGMYAVALIGVILFVTGVYRFALLMTGDPCKSGYASLFAVASSSFAETLHVFGQLPSIIGISILMHALPYIYVWLINASKIDLLKGLALIGVTVASHHVTPIFGMIFFIFPVIGMAIMDHAKMDLGQELTLRFRHFFKSFLVLFWRIVLFGFSSLVLIIGIILPYWINSKNNPITQVPIPHGSRDSFIEVLSSGFIFFLVPYGVLLFLLPYCFYRFYSKRYLFFGISLTILFVLGTGGTTPIPRKILGETAFNILTLDRFTLWASILVLPMIGEFIFRFVEGDIRDYLRTKFGKTYYYLTATLYGGFISLFLILTLVLFKFRPSQPPEIKMQPIINFLDADDHDKWRYMTLGFGDQMAWLSTQTEALSVDGNYHSARRLPELTTRAVERLENSKFLGIEGLGSLQQFLTVPHKYNLRYVFSNDKFYDPILHFAGWKRLTQLENGIHVWERLYVPPLKTVLPKDKVAVWQSLYWGVVPVSTLLIALLISLLLPLSLLNQKLRHRKVYLNVSNWKTRQTNIWTFNIFHVWSYLMGFVFIGLIGLFVLHAKHQSSPQKVLEAYYDSLDFKAFDKAYTFLDPGSVPSKADYTLGLSVSDGILNSYGKLDKIEIQVLEQTDSYAKASVICEYVTPLKLIKKTYDHTLIFKDGNWYIIYEPLSKDLPPQLYQSNPDLEFHVHGRRQIKSGKTYREDIIDQPVIQTIQASLVKQDDQYVIVGEIQNIDVLPADVAIEGSLYTSDNQTLATYSTMYVQKHVLLPMETSVFKLEFEQTAWLENNTSKSNIFDPQLKMIKALSDEPSHFQLHITSNVTDVVPYQEVAIMELSESEGQLEAQLFNNGSQEVSIPQVLIAYHNNSNQLIWVDHTFVPSNIRQQRKINFDYTLTDLSEVIIISNDMDQVFCNGERNLPPSNQNRHKDLFKTGENMNLSLSLNNFIGNPN